MRRGLLPLAAGVSVAVASAAVVAGAAGSTLVAVPFPANTAPIEAAADQDWKPCTACPPFVRVPGPPKHLRSLRYVSKYELRWNDYLKAVDDGTCPLPEGRSNLHGVSSADIKKHHQDLRLDWSATILRPAEVECYVRWLQGKTSYRVALPSPREWDWFARAGIAERKFPWGNEPSAAKEALRGNSEIPGKLHPYAPTDRRRGANLIVSGVSAGQFTPNPWGIHDLLGNNFELTNLVLSPRDFARRTGKPGLLDYPSVVLKGVDYVGAEWRDGIAQEHYTIIVEGRYAARSAVRLILIERGA